ncbi:PBSX family phage terminase large subunit [Bacillus mobilis]|uniref:PBSX family phage terminase large subunit n=1 Tax=Bacillus mobilis TaxID=2026190 RepID=UPI003D66112A
MPKIKLNIERSYFNDAYIPYLNRPERIQVFYGSAGSGKSRFLATKLVIDLMKERTKLLVIRQTFASIRDSVYAEFLTVLEEMKLLQFVNVSKTSLTITFPNGSSIVYKGCDDEQKLLSISGIDACWIEEASQISFEIWTQLLLRLRGGDKKKKFYLSFNPTSAASWLKREFFDNPMEDSFVCKTTYKDNRFLDAEYIASLEDMKVRNPQKYEIYGLGNWGLMGKRVFDNWKVEEFDKHNLVRSNPKLKSAFGMDWGYVADPSTLICSLVDIENRKLYVFDEMYEKGLLNNQIADKIRDMGYAKELIIADSAEQKSIAEIRQYGITRVKPARKGAGSVMNGIQYAQQFDIVVHPSCVHTVDELSNYSYIKDSATGLYLNKVEDRNNHLLDALRYSLETYMRQAKKSTLNKAMFGL